MKRKSGERRERLIICGADSQSSVACRIDILAEGAEERAMAEKLISGDNHIDLTYLPPDLWSSQAPDKWKIARPPRRGEG